MGKEKSKLKQLVIKTYSNIASQGSCCATRATCCSPEIQPMNLLETGKLIGYSEEELKLGLGEANLGLGCGNPLAIAELKEGETVLDLGSGAGFDAFLCSMRVGKGGHVIGIDMTPEMVTKAKENARKLGIKNVEFRHGDIEHLPVEDNSVNVIISNCVINLSPNKQAVFREALRVLKPEGRLAISDILKKGGFSEAIKQNEKAYSGWITGAVPVEELKEMLREAGFVSIAVKDKEKSDEIIKGWNFGEGVENMVFSAYIRAKKPWGRRSHFHATPHKNNLYWYQDRPDKFFLEMAEKTKADVMIYGHTHKPYRKDIEGKVFINAGSVGKPKDGDPRACVMLFEIADETVKHEFLRVPYDVEKVASAIVASGLPPGLADRLREGR